MPLTLYYHPLASFCHKALIALYENGTAFERRIIDFGNEKDWAELRARWPMGKFPVLRDQARSRDVAESSIIVEYLDHFYPGERPLIPEDWETALQVRFWDRILDNYLQTPMQQIVADKMQGAKGDMRKARAMLETSYRLLDSHMAGKSWIAGQDFTMADCAAAPALLYAAAVQTFPAELGSLAGYFDRLLDRPAVRRVIDEARPYFAMFPFADGIPAQYR